MDWQPIETAPKDGDEIILWGTLEGSAHSRPHIGCEDWYLAYWDEGGWQALHYEGWIVEPTHWRAAPTSPATTTTGD